MTKNKIYWIAIVFLAATTLQGCSSNSTSEQETDNTLSQVDTDAPDNIKPSSETAPSSLPDNTSTDTIVPISIREVLPDRETLFGEPIDNIPLPISDEPTLTNFPDNTALFWEYDIVDEQLSNAFYEAPLSHKLAWEGYSALIPLQYRKTLQHVSFLFYTTDTGLCSFADAAFNAGTYGKDGEMGIESGTLEICERVGSWYFTANQSSVEPLDSLSYKSLWIHETGHLIAANYMTQLTTPNGEFYPTLISDAEFPTGLSTAKDSLLGQYYEQFWFNEVGDFLISIRTQGKSIALLYEQYPDSFVSEYAATNSSEDFAESFDAFITFGEKPAPDGKMKTDKIRFFWDFPEFVLMRDNIRARL